MKKIRRVSYGYVSQVYRSS